MKSKKRSILLLMILFAMLLAGYFGTLGLRLLFADRTWMREFGYQQDEIHRLSFDRFGFRGCPEIPVSIGATEFNLGFDTGCGSGLGLTNALEEKIDFTLLGQNEQLNRDGTHRGWSKQVSINEITVFGEASQELETTISDWKMFSTSKFNGMIGLAYFQSRVITLDYQGRKIAVSSRPVHASELDPDKYVILPLHWSTSEGQSTLPFFQVEYNGKPAMAYLDTGKNHSYVYIPSCNNSMSERPFRFTDASIKIGSMEVALKGVAQVNDLAQAEGLPYPTMIELNSDQIWKCRLLVTIDLIDQRIIFSRK